MDCVRTMVVHVNRLQHRVQPQPVDRSTGNLNTFVPADSDPSVSPRVDYIILPASPPLPYCRGDTSKEKDILQINFCLKLVQSSNTEGHV